MTEELRSIRIQHLHLAPFHHRTNWGDMNALRDSIATSGIIEPLIVRDRKAGGYEIVCGARRFKASTMADLKTAACIVRELTDVEAIAMQAEENLKREGLHPMDEAEYFHELNQRAYDAGDIAKRFGVKRRDVVRRLKLLALTKVARAAFVAGKIDEDAAMALAKLGSEAKQADVIAAVQAGSLQVEEIPSYVASHFTASLGDVPWKLTDAKLVPKAGSCGDCPKRSDVQKDLFGEVAGVRCIDIDCFRAKMDAVWKLESGTVERGERAGSALHDADMFSLFMPTAGGRPTVMKSSGMVDADAPCPHMTGHSWSEAIAAALKEEGGEPPTEYLARDQDGRPRQVYREATASRLVRKSDAAQESAAEERSADPTKPDALAPSARAEGKVRRTLIQQLAERVIANDHDTWGWVATRIIESVTARSISMVALILEDSIKETGLEGKAALIELIGKSNRQARRIATSLLIFDEADSIGDIGEPVRALAKACEIDIAELERAIRSGSK